MAVPARLIARSAAVHAVSRPTPRGPERGTSDTERLFPKARACRPARGLSGPVSRRCVSRPCAPKRPGSDGQARPRHGAHEAARVCSGGRAWLDCINRGLTRYGTDNRHSLDPRDPDTAVTFLCQNEAAAGPGGETCGGPQGIEIGTCSVGRLDSLTHSRLLLDLDAQLLFLFFLNDDPRRDHHHQALGIAADAHVLEEAADLGHLRENRHAAFVAPFAESLDAAQAAPCRRRAR